MPENDDVVAARTEQTLSNDPMDWKKLPIALIKQFGDYLKLKYLNNENAININEQKELEEVFRLGLIQAKNSLYRFDSPLLHREKSPRRDEWKRLGSIASQFLKIQTYPIIPGVALTAILNKALGHKDPRTLEAYRKTVLHYCNFDEIRIGRGSDSSFGQIDVSFFVHLIPKQYINVDTASSTSLFVQGQSVPVNAVKTTKFGA